MDLYRRLGTIRSAVLSQRRDFDMIRNLFNNGNRGIWEGKLSCGTFERLTRTFFNARFSIARRGRTRECHLSSPIDPHHAFYCRSCNSPASALVKPAL